jgi:hypothetical protein
MYGEIHVRALLLRGVDFRDHGVRERSPGGEDPRKS